MKRSRPIPSCSESWMLACHLLLFEGLKHRALTLSQPRMSDLLLSPRAAGIRASPPRKVGFSALLNRSMLLLWRRLALRVASLHSSGQRATLSIAVSSPDLSGLARGGRARGTLALRMASLKVPWPSVSAHHGAEAPAPLAPISRPRPARAPSAPLPRPRPRVASSSASALHGSVEASPSEEARSGPRCGAQSLPPRQQGEESETGEQHLLCPELLQELPDVCS